MRGLLALVAVLALAWAGYWVVGSRAVHRAAEACFAQVRAQGLTADHGRLAVRGFPSRFDPFALTLKSLLIC